MLSMQNDETTVRIPKRVKKKLDEFGTLSDTYATVIDSMVEHCKKCEKYRKVKNHGSH